MNDATTPMTISIPNDDEAMAFFIESRSYWKSEPQYIELQKRLNSLKPVGIILFESGSEEHAIYTVYCAVLVSETKAVRLTNASANFEELKSIREMPLDVRIFADLFTRLDEAAAVMPSMSTLPIEATFVDDGLAYYVSWGRGDLSHRVYLYENFIGFNEQPDTTGIASVDRLLQIVNNVVNRL